MSKTRLSGICLFALGLSLFAQDTPPRPAVQGLQRLPQRLRDRCP